MAQLFTAVVQLQDGSTVLIWEECNESDADKVGNAAESFCKKLQKGTHEKLKEKLNGRLVQKVSSFSSTVVNASKK